MLRKIVVIFLILGCFLLQSTVADIIPFNMYKPNFLLILTAAFGLMHGKRSGILIGFFSGLLIDLMYCDVVGINALILLYIGFFSGCFYQIFFDDDIRISICLIAVTDLFYNLAFYFVQLALNNTTDFGAYFTQLILPEIIATVVVGIFLFKLFYYINKKLVKIENEKRESPWLIR